MKQSKLNRLMPSAGCRRSSTCKLLLMTLLVMLLTTASAWAQSIAPTTYRLTLNPNYEGGVVGMVDVQVSNPTYTLTKYDVPSRAGGYTFSGWSDSSNGEIRYQTGDIVTLTGNLTLYAIWNSHYTLEYEINKDKGEAELTGYKGDEPTSIIIPSDAEIDGQVYLVTIIGYEAFRDCDNLTSITIPSSVTSIGAKAFYRCGTLRSVTLNSNPRIGEEAFVKDGNGTTPAVTMNLTAHEAGGVKWMTFCSSYGNFEADNHTQVFQAELNNATGALTLREIDDKIVKAGEGVILRSTDNPVMTLTNNNSSDAYLYNSLSGVADLGGKYANGNIYVLNRGSNGVGFYKLANGKTVGYGKAYLTCPASAREFFAFEETTGIADVRSKMSDVRGDYYDLQGRRVDNPAKGLYIVNGKKIVKN